MGTIDSIHSQRNKKKLDGEGAESNQLHTIDVLKDFGLQLEEEQTPLLFGYDQRD